MNFVFATVIFLLSIFPAHSAVNMRNGSYTESWIDYIDPGKGYELKIERFYSSRSLFIGLFGFGWCSSLETQLEITSDGIINLTECGGGLEVTYYPESFDLRSSEVTINSIVDHFKKKQTMTSNDIKNLRAQLRSNSKMRFEYANKLHLVNVKKLKSQKNIFNAKSKGVEKILFDGKHYSRKKYDGSTERFNKKGKLTQVINPTGQWIKLNYKGNKLVFLADNKGRRINFAYDNNGRLKKIYNGNGLQATYSFESENLVSMKNMWQKTYRYKYDINHNLTQVLFPDNTKIKMSYDLTNDWIKSYDNRIGCHEDFAFTMSKANPKNHYWGTYKRKCNKGSTLLGRHEFWYKSYNFSKDKYLHRAKEIQNTDYRDIYFHPYLGRATSLRENLEYQGFAYYLNGLLNKNEKKMYTENKQIESWTKSSFRYDLKSFKMTEAIKFTLDKKSKVIKKDKSSFSYNKRGLLRKMTTANGRAISITFGEDGRIATLKDNKKNEIQLNYENGLNKPSSIALKGLGGVTITYDNQGEVAKVENNSKRNVASSVIETFLEMIEALGPMGEILKI